MALRYRTRRWGAASVVALLGATATLAAATGAPAAEPDCAQTADTETEAVGIATACGHEVEALDARTAWDTVVAQPDGTVRLDTSIAAVRTRVSGEWAEIDTTVVPTGDGLTVVSPVTPMTFSDGSAGMPLATIERDGHALSLDAPVDLTEPVVDGDRVTYPEVLPGVDLVLTVHPDGTGFSEVLRVASPEAAGHPALAELAFPLQTSDGIEIEPVDGAFAAVDETGAQVFSSPAPVMWDSGADRSFSRTVGGLLRGAPAEDLAEERTAGPQEGDRVVPMETVVTSDAVTITPDAEVLASEATAWPVYIDPGVSGTRQTWAMIQSAYPDTSSGYGFSGTEGTGRCVPAEDRNCSKNSVFRVAWEFQDLGLIGGLSPDEVISATFMVFGDHSWSCSPTGVGLFSAGEVHPWTTWNNHAWSWGAMFSSASVSHRASCGTQRWLAFDATQAARNVATYGTTNVGLGLGALDLTSMASSWKRYRYDATLSITYNRAPVVVGMAINNPPAPCVRGAARPVIRSATPTLWVTAVDPDGLNLQVTYGLYRQPGFQRVDYVTSAYVASGSSVPYSVRPGALVHGGIYEWHAQASDAYGWWGPGGICEFEVDLVAPDVPPGVAPVAGHPAVYDEDAVAGGIGVGGRFAFTNGGVSDVVSYHYSFGSDSLDKTVSVAAGGTVAFTPTSVGTQRLYVQSVDRAGWTSPVRMYRFNVAFPGKDAHWPLDEGAGSSATDVSGNANTLTITGRDVWGPGMLADLGGIDEDRALVFGADGEGAATAGPVVAPNESFTVMAMVKPSVLDGTARTAVSQDGETGSGFTLGLRADAGCAEPTGCWTFSMSGEDAAAPAVRGQAVSPRPVVADEWVHLAAVHDAQAKTVSLYVCDPTNLDDPPPTPVSAPFAQTWNAAGALRLGQAQAGGLTEQWAGGIDDVRVYRGVVGFDQIVNVCHVTEG